MNTTSKATTDTLKELILLNNDRHEGYQKAIEQTKDADLKQLFSTLSEQSQKYSQELQSHYPDKEDMPKSDETKNTGKLYRVWMDIKNALSTNDRHSVLAACEYGEDVIKKGYKDALEDKEDLDAQVLSIVEKQYNSILESHNRVKTLRDSAK